MQINELPAVTVQYERAAVWAFQIEKQDFDWISSNVDQNVANEQAWAGPKKKICQSSDES